MTGIASRNEVLASIYATGHVVLPSGETRRAEENGMPRAEGERIYDLVCAERPRATLEIGMAFGLSTLFICQALADSGGERHVAIDPNQSRDYAAMGLEHLTRSGLRSFVDFREESSHLALPKLEMAGASFDFAFVDGVHLFDYTLLEFFYIDRMLRVGGVVVFDDLQLPAVRKVVRYAITNRGYTDESRVADTGMIRRLGRRGKRLAHGLMSLPAAAAFALSGERTECLVSELGWPRENGLAILRKTRDDDRAWTHHAEF